MGFAHIPRYCEEKSCSFMTLGYTMHKMPQCEITWIYTYTNFFICFTHHCLLRGFSLFLVTSNETILTIFVTSVLPPQKKNLSVTNQKKRHFRNKQKMLTLHSNTILKNAAVCTEAFDRRKNDVRAPIGTGWSFIRKKGAPCKRSYFPLP